MLVVLISIVALAAATSANTNPCLDTSISGVFRNDWASCGSYFYCNADREAIPSGPCRFGLGFNENSQFCSTNSFPCEPCPDRGIMAVAIPEDTECRTFRYCVEGTLRSEQFTCATGLRFNRAIAVCDWQAKVVCPPQASLAMLSLSSSKD